MFQNNLYKNVSRILIARYFKDDKSVTKITIYNGEKRLTRITPEQIEDWGFPPVKDWEDMGDYWEYCFKIVNYK